MAPTRTTGTAGITLLISAAAVAATVGGWIGLSTAADTEAPASATEPSLAELPAVATVAPLDPAQAGAQAAQPAPLRRVTAAQVRPPALAMTRSSQ